VCVSAADVDVVHVVEVGLLGPAVTSASSEAEPEHGPKEPGVDGRVANCDGGVIDAEEGAGTVGVAPFTWCASVMQRRGRRLADAPMRLDLLHCRVSQVGVADVRHSGVEPVRCQPRGDNPAHTTGPSGHQGSPRGPPTAPSEAMCPHPPATASLTLA